MRLGVILGSGTMRKQFDGFGLFGLQLGVFEPEDRFCINFGLLYMPTNFTEETDLSNALDNEMELAINISGRYYFTPPHTFMGIYLHGGVRQGLFFWRYKNAFKYEEDGKIKEQSSDQIGTFWMYLGLGVSLIQTEHFHIGCNAAGGIKTYYENTVAGFENDLFTSTFYTQLVFDITSAWSE